MVQTPRLDRLAARGMRYTAAFSTVPICAPSRSAFMTGTHVTTIDAQHMRSHRHDQFHLPNGVRPIMHRLIDAGYFTANIRTLGDKTVGTCKIDLNFEVQGPVLRETAADKRCRQEARKAPEGGTVDSRVLDVENEIRLFHTDDWAELKDRGHAEFGDPGLRSQTAISADGGEIDWANVRHELARLNFSGWATAEIKGGGDRERLAGIVKWDGSGARLVSATNVTSMVQGIKRREEGRYR